jgi:uncharacterized membrane protein YbhN (UPF0104 family)
MQRDASGAQAAQGAHAQPHRARTVALRVAKITVAVCVAGVIFEALGGNVGDWLADLWDVLTGVSPEYIVAGVALTTVQTIATAEGWYGILRVAYGRKAVRRREVLACYATAVALNGFLPANLGTLVCLLMFVSVIAGATFSGILGGYVVEKIFFTAAGAFVYVYLLASGSSWNLGSGVLRDHPVALVTTIAGAALLVAFVARLLRRRFAAVWDNAKNGGRILAQPRTFLGHVVLPQLIGWWAYLGTIAVFLSAYAIPVSFHTVMSVVGGNSIANTTSLTPGGIGVNQALNVASLNGVADPTTATAYSVAQQLVTTAWSQILAIVLVVWTFGWSGGRALVGESYEEAKQKTTERKGRKQEQERKADGRPARSGANDEGAGGGRSGVAGASGGHSLLDPRPEHTVERLGSDDQARRERQLDG